jgi:dTDP-4-dehydrorhamnose reductase
MRLLEQPRDALARHSGVYHLSSRGETTWHGFAGAIVAGMDLEHPPDVAAITTSEYPTPARRPAYAVLSPSRLASVFGITLPQWDVALRECQESK